MLVVVSGSFTLAFGADFTFQISGLGLSKCHSTRRPRSFIGFVGVRGSVEARCDGRKVSQVFSRSV